MISIPGTSTLCKCEDQLIESLADSATFQSFTSSVDADAAKMHIFVNELPAPPVNAQDEYSDAYYDALFPIAIIEEQDGIGPIEYLHTSDGGRWGYIHNLTFHVAIEALRGAGSNEDVHRQFKDTCANILEELIARSGTAGYFSISSATHSSVGWFQPDVEGGTERLRMVFRLRYEGG